MTRLRRCVCFVLLLLYTWLSGRFILYRNDLDTKIHYEFDSPLQNSYSLTSNERSWCPEAKCVSTSHCNPCRRRFLIVVAVARSASTTLTWMLDTLPGVRMGGENNDVINNIRAMINATTRPPFLLQPNPESKYSAWYHNPISSGAFACVGQMMIEAIVPPEMLNGTHVDPHEQEDIIGFKTIRLLWSSATSVQETAQFLKDTFPCARFLINIRSDVLQQADSQTFAFSFSRNIEDVEKLRQTLMGFTSRLQMLSQELGNQAMTLDSTRWTKNLEELNEVVRWLGFDKTCSFKKLLGLNTGSSTRKNTNASDWGLAFQHTETRLETDPRCHYVS